MDESPPLLLKYRRILVTKTFDLGFCYYFSLECQSILNSRQVVTWMDYDQTRDHLITVGKDNLIKIWSIKEALQVNSRDLVTTHPCLYYEGLTDTHRTT